tara:strand:+ start:227 stop:484 length:258 start_codon:yes stop_codon:yes gene_type:complete
MKVYIAYVFKFSTLDEYRGSVWRHFEIGTYATEALAEAYAKKAFEEEVASAWGDAYGPYKMNGWTEERFDEYRRWYIEEKTVISE